MEKQSPYAPSNSPCYSDDIRALAQAFLLAQKHFRATGKDGSNTHQKYNYAYISQIYDAVKPALEEQNIIIWHNSLVIDGKEYIQTRLIHALTGQWSQDIRFKESEKPGNQGKGAADTYLKKYAVLCLCAIPTEDDDGESEQKHVEERKRNVISEEQKQEIISTLKECTNSQELINAICKHYKLKHMGELPQDSFEPVMSYILKNQS